MQCIRCLSCFSCKKFSWFAVWESRIVLFGFWTAIQVRLLSSAKKLRCAVLVTEYWEACMFPNHSCFVVFSEGHFLERIRLSNAMEEVCSSVLRKDFHKDCRRFLEDFVRMIFSTVAACSLDGQGFSCFWPDIVIGRDNYLVFYFFDQLLDKFLNLNWLERSDVEAAKTEFHSFLRKQRHVGYIIFHGNKTLFF